MVLTFWFLIWRFGLKGEGRHAFLHLNFCFLEVFLIYIIILGMISHLKKKIWEADMSYIIQKRFGLRFWHAKPLTAPRNIKDFSKCPVVDPFIVNDVNFLSRNSVELRWHHPFWHQQQTYFSINVWNWFSSGTNGVVGKKAAAAGASRILKYSLQEVEEGQIICFKFENKKANVFLINQMCK